MSGVKTSDRQFFGNASALLFMNLLASALNYGYQVLLARLLSVDAFGAIYAVFSLLLVTSVPGATFTMLASQRLANLTAKKDWDGVLFYVRDMTKRVTLFSLGVFAAGLACWYPLGLLLKRQDAALLLAVILACALGYYHPFYTGCMSGAGRFVLAGLYGLMIPAYKLLGLAGVILAGSESQKLLNVLFTILLGSVFTACFGYACFRGRAGTAVRPAPERDKTAAGLWAASLLVNICLSVYLNADVFAARWVGGETVSGLYSAVSLFGKMVYYCAAALGTVLLPAVAVVDGARSRQLLKKAVLVTGGLSAAGLLVLNLIRQPLVLLLYGEAYRPAAEYMSYVSLISFSVGLLTLLTNYFVGISQVGPLRNALLALVACVAVACLISGEVRTVLLLIGMAGLVCVLYLLLQVWKMDRKAKTQPDGTTKSEERR